MSALLLLLLGAAWGQEAYRLTEAEEDGQRADFRAMLTDQFPSCALAELLFVLGERDLEVHTRMLCRDEGDGPGRDWGWCHASLVAEGVIQGDHIEAPGPLEAEARFTTVEITQRVEGATTHTSTGTRSKSCSASLEPMSAHIAHEDAGLRLDLAAGQRLWLEPASVERPDLEALVRAWEARQP